MNTGHDLLGAYCTDALDPAERADFERHLRACPDCRTEAAEFREILGALSDTVASPPPVTLEGRVLEAARPTETRTPVPEAVTGVSAAAAPDPTAEPAVQPAAGAAHGDHGRTPGSWGRAAPWLAAVAAGVLFFVLGVQVGETRAPDQTASAAMSQMTDVVAVTSAPDAEVMAVDMMGTTARVVVSEDMDYGVFLASGLPLPAQGMAYQVWRVMADGDAQSAGVFVPDSQGYVALVLDGSSRGVQKYAITLEPPGGSQFPTGKMLGEVDA